MESDAFAEGPIASTHIFRFAGIREAGRNLFLDRRMLEPFEGLRFSCMVFVGAVRSEGFTIGVVEPRRHMAFRVWEDEASLERFKQRSPIARRWQSTTDEYCEIRMVPLRTHGNYRGREPLAGMRPVTGAEGPTAVWTFADIPLRTLPYFWRAIRPAARRLLRSSGLVAGTAGVEHSYRGAMTFTLWESPADAIRFAYRESPHREIVKRVREEGLLTTSMFIRFRPYAVEGRWPRSSRFHERFEQFSLSLRDEASGPGKAIERTVAGSGLFPDP